MIKSRSNEYVENKKAEIERDIAIRKADVDERVAIHKANTEEDIENRKADMEIERYEAKRRKDDIEREMYEVERHKADIEERIRVHLSVFWPLRSVSAIREPRFIPGAHDLAVRPQSTRIALSGQLWKGYVQDTCKNRSQEYC